jgi:hypothetical protein
MHVTRRKCSSAENLYFYINPTVSGILKDFIAKENIYRWLWFPIISVDRTGPILTKILGQQPKSCVSFSFCKNFHLLVCISHMARGMEKHKIGIPGYTEAAGCNSFPNVAQFLLCCHREWVCYCLSAIFSFLEGELETKYLLTWSKLRGSLIWVGLAV